MASTLGILQKTQHHYFDDKSVLLTMLDTASIDVSDPSEDKTPNAISIKVDGDKVVGTEGGLIIFKFHPKTRALTGIIVWNERVNNENQ